LGNAAMLARTDPWERIKIIAALKAHYHPVSPGLAPRGPAYDQVIDVSLRNQELFKNIWP
jgi:hypothetical protein